MDEFQWREYYQGMVHRGGMRPEKRREMVEKCGGRDSHPEVIDEKEITVYETQQDAEARLMAEIEVIYGQNRKDKT